MDNKSQRITAAVLAGGKSSRMGRDKAFLQIDGQPLLAHQLHRLREVGASELLISGRRDADYAKFGVKIMHDEQEGYGPLAGLIAILTVAQYDLVLLLPVDMPGINAGLLRSIVAASTNELGCVPHDSERLQPLIATYPKRILPLAKLHLHQGDLSMQSLVREAIHRGTMHTLPLAPEQQKGLANWNTPSDLPADISASC